MWMVDPKIMCRKHLLGEHNELHKHLHNWRKKYKIDGRISGNAIEPLSYKKRHEELVLEMKRRKYNHQSPIEQPDFSYLSFDQQSVMVNKENSLQMLKERCSECRDMIMK